MRSHIHPSRNYRKRLDNNSSQSNHYNNLNHPFDYREKLAKSTSILADLEKKTSSIIK